MKKQRKGIVAAMALTFVFLLLAPLPSMAKEKQKTMLIHLKTSLSHDDAQICVAYNMIWAALDEGLKVVGCRGALIRHEEFHDERKQEDLTVGDKDNAKLFAKWNLPEKNAYPDPGPAYRQMLAERGLA